MGIYFTLHSAWSLKTGILKGLQIRSGPLKAKILTLKDKSGPQQSLKKTFPKKNTAHRRNYELIEAPTI